MPPADGAAAQPEYLVKWLGRAHIHNEWVPEHMLQQIAKRKLASFKRRHGVAAYDAMEPLWTLPERLVARRPAPAGPGWEVLVKWTALGCEHCTWEVIFAAHWSGVYAFFET